MVKPYFTRQQGASAIGIIIALAVIGICVFLGMQYIPQYMESGKIDSILTSIEKAHEETPATSKKDVQNMVSKRLVINDMKDMGDAFQVEDMGGKYLVKVSYERDLNLLYEKRTIVYEKRLELSK